MSPSRYECFARLLQRFYLFSLLLVNQSNFYVIGAESNSDITNADSYQNDELLNEISIIENLDKFQSISVRFHSCIWSQSSSIDDGQNTNQNNNNNNNNNNQDSSWYSELVPPSRANVAYSLYGTLRTTNQSSSILRKKWNNCGAKRYINSFYTTSGFEVFTESLVSAGADDFWINFGNNTSPEVASLSSECSVSTDEETGEIIGTTVACSGTTFGLYTFGVSPFSSTSTCHSNAIQSETDTLIVFNKLLRKHGYCIEIFNAGNDNGTESEGTINTGTGNASIISLLTNSSVCTLSDPFGVCPDPFHKLLAYEATLSIEQREVYEIYLYHQTLIKSSILLGFGAVTLLAALFIRRNEYQKSRAIVSPYFRYQPTRSISDCSSFNSAESSDDDNSANASSKGSNRNIFNDQLQRAKRFVAKQIAMRRKQQKACVQHNEKYAEEVTSTDGNDKTNPSAEFYTNTDLANHGEPESKFPLDNSLDAIIFVTRSVPPNEENDSSTPPTLFAPNADSNKSVDSTTHYEPNNANSLTQPELSQEKYSVNKYDRSVKSDEAIIDLGISGFSLGDAINQTLSLTAIEEKHLSLV